MIQRHNPSRVVSLLDPGSEFPDLGPRYVDKHLRLEFHDIHFPLLTCRLPALAHFDELMRFIHVWNPADTLLIHCHAGIGRSPATAYITACFHNPHVDERDIAIQLRRASPLARPNELWIRIADDALGRNGRMIAAITETGRNLPCLNVIEGEAFQIPSVFPATSPKRR